MGSQTLRHTWLVTDLDGTLLDGRQQIVARSQKALDHFQELGGQVFVATGRIETSALPYYRALGLHTPAILHNGARVSDLATGRALMRQGLADGSVAAILKAVENVDVRYSAAVFADQSVYAATVDDALRGYAARDGIEFRIRADLSGLRASKMLLIVAEEDQEAVLAAVASVERTHVVQSERTYLEVLPQGADKGSALGWMLAQRSASAADVVAVGDGMNDLAMLGVAGIGACVADAHPDVVAAADCVVASCAAGGVADAVDLAINGLR